MGKFSSAWVNELDFTKSRFLWGWGGGGVWKGRFSDRNGYNGVQEEGRGTGTIGVFDA